MLAYGSWEEEEDPEERSVTLAQVHILDPRQWVSRAWVSLSDLIYTIHVWLWTKLQCSHLWDSNVIKECCSYNTQSAWNIYGLSSTKTNINYDNKETTFNLWRIEILLLDKVDSYSSSLWWRKIWEHSIFFKFETREFIAAQLIRNSWVHRWKSVQEFKVKGFF